MLRVGIAFDPFFLRADAFCRTVAALGAFWRHPIDFHEHRLINIGAESAFDGFEIRLVVIGCKLDTGAGDVWTWVAIDANTKLVPYWRIGDRSLEPASVFEPAPTRRNLVLRLREVYGKVERGSPRAA